MTTSTHKTDLTRVLADFCADHALHERFSDSAITLAELAIADSIGCILAGVDDPASVKLGRTLPDEPAGGARKSSSVRHRHPLSARDAAAVNACAGHARELDDNVMPGAVHSSVVLTPALFALGEAVGASGAAVVHAFIVGQEVNTHIVNLVGYEHIALGWHTNSSVGVFGAAAACATLLKLDSDRIAHALSLAFSMASGSHLQFGSDAKPLHCGIAAAGGVWAAQLAEQGLGGNANVFQGKYSFEHLYAGARDANKYEPALFPDAPLAIDDNPPVAKLYPCCGSAHLGIDALRALQARHGFALDAIERIDVHMLRQMVDNLQHDAPVDEKQARFSMPYCAAVTLVHGIPRLEHFTPQAVSHPDPAVARLMPFVHKHVRDPSPEALAKRLTFIGDCLVCIRLKSGEVLSVITEHPKGCQHNPLAPGERHRKFMDCASPVLGQARSEQLEAKLLRLSVQPAIGPLAAELRAS